MKVTVTDAYRDWSPPRWLRSVVVELLDAVDSRFLVGLTAVVLTNTAGLSRARRRGATWARGRKVRLVQCSGLYHSAYGRQGAWIELFADQVLAGWPGWVGHLGWLREQIVSAVLCHELGHHIHATNKHPEHRDREKCAERWRRWLQDEALRRRRPWTLRVLRPLRPLVRRALRLIWRPPARRQARSTA